VPELSDAQRRQLQELRQAYEAELPEKVTSIANAAAALRLRDWDPAGVEELHQLVHRLAGSSAIWGFTAVSKAAGELEELVLAALHGTPRPRPELSDAVRRLLEQLQHAVPPAPLSAIAPARPSHHK
jgi:HPt (histidine-containing phosphotransfer) domain-containing protein